jgi:DNA-3-methyladenine glycosylase
MMNDTLSKIIILQQPFFARPTLNVARELLGQLLVREVNGQRLSGLIVETEAYIGPNDTANHASKGRTPRTGVMFGPSGRAYVYLIYGIHSMLNLVTEAEGFPAAVLIRAIEPVEGLEVMRTYRSLTQEVSRPNLTNGPGKLCRALQIDLSLNNWEVSLGQKLWIEAGQPVAEAAIASGPRIGIDYARPEHRAAPWRFWVRGNPFVSR